MKAKILNDVTIYRADDGKRLVDEFGNAHHEIVIKNDDPQPIKFKEI